MRVWLKSADGKSSVVAVVSDLNNGSYVAEALLKWPGVTLVRVSLTYPVEYLRALTEMFHTVHTLRWITDIFDDGKGSQEVGLATGCPSIGLHAKKIGNADVEGTNVCVCVCVW